MKTLVIHPKDPTTDFLCPIYEGKDWNVIRTLLSRSLLIQLVGEHDRIIMLGHGTESGLLGFGQFIINSEFVFRLKHKQLVGIWCNADVFFKKYGLTGLYTGMIISEIGEAYMMGLNNFNDKQIDESNELFAKTIKQHIEDKDQHKLIVEGYRGENNPIIEYNNQRIYENKNNTYISKGIW